MWFHHPAEVVKGSWLINNVAITGIDEDRSMLKPGVKKATKYSFNL